MAVDLSTPFPVAPRVHCVMHVGEELLGKATCYLSEYRRCGCTTLCQAAASSMERGTRARAANERRPGYLLFPVL